MKNPNLKYILISGFLTDTNKVINSSFENFLEEGLKKVYFFNDQRSSEQSILLNKKIKKNLPS